MTGQARSLRWRLLAATLAGLGVALVLAWLALGNLFADHVRRQFEDALTQQLDQLTARLDFSPDGTPRIAPDALSDPRWQRPLSGLYWQIDAVDAAGHSRPAALRSRSLWDAELALPGDALANGQVHVHQVPGPQDSQLLVLERTVRAAGAAVAAGDAGSGPAPAGPPLAAESSWRLIVAGDMAPIRAAEGDFSRVLAASLAVLGALLALAAWAQVAVGLRPLHALQRSLRALQDGRADRLDGRFPAEVQPLVEGFNQVLDRNTEMVAQARTQAGNLAHALKTPLAVLDQLAARPPAGDEWAPQVRAQVAAARRQVDWHLARARMMARHTPGQPGTRCAVAPLVQGLVRTLERLYAGRGLAFETEWAADLPDYAGDAQDLQEILGNLLDNACKWARSRVRVQVHLCAADPAQGLTPGATLEFTVEDDGPGIAPDRLQAVVARGVRLDESVPGSGLGLAIVQDSVRLQGGALELDRSAALGGLRVTVQLPAHRA